MASKMSRFVDNRHSTTSPTPPTATRADRAGAQNLKLPNYHPTKPTSSKLASTTLTTGYVSNGPATRKMLPESDYYPQQVPTARGGLDDSSIASDFDATITSDIDITPSYAQDHGYYSEDQQMEQVNYQPHNQSHRVQPTSSQHALQHKQSYSPFIKEDDTQRRIHTSSINTRVDRPQHQFGDLVVRPGEEHTSGQFNQEPRKRSRSSERTTRQSTFSEDRSSQMGDLENEEEEHPEPEVEDLGVRMEEEDGDFQTPSNSPRKKRQEREPVVGDFVAGNRRPVITGVLPEYSDAVLKKMSYADLEKEAWDKPDDRKSFQLAKPLRENDTFQAKMEHYVFKEGQDSQVSFYEQINPEDWVEGGDWFVDKFTDLLNEIKLKRAEKKKCTKKYEEEISAREKLVRGKSDYLDKEFKYMRVGGEGILRGKRI